MEMMMRFNKGCLLAVLASIAVGVLPAPAQITGPGSTIPWNNKQWYIYGVNYPWYNYGTDFGTGGWGKYTDFTSTAASSVNTSFATMKGQGAHIQRWWVFADGRYSPEFNANGTVSGLDGQFMTDVDTALRVADANNQYLLLTVMDSSMWSNATYANPVQQGGHAAIISDPATQQSYLDNALKPFLQHVAASPYKNRVLGYDIVNEPEGQMAGYWGGQANFSAAQVQTFVQKCATYIHTYGAGAYATVGSAAPIWVTTWKNLGLDFYEMHYYPGFDRSGPGSGLPTYASLGLDRPCVVGEFASNDTSYGLNDTAPLSANWYLNTIYNDGYAGALAWSYSNADSATKWSAFQPVFTQWEQAHAAIVGPQPVAAALPAITSTNPNNAPTQSASGPGITLVVNGSNFENNLSVVKWNGSAQPTSFVSDSQLTANIPASDLTIAGSASVIVTNNPATVSDPNAGNSNAVVFQIGMPNLSISIVPGGMTRNVSTGEIVINIKVTNAGTVDAGSVQLTSATLGASAKSSVQATAPLPTMGTIPQGGSATATLRFPGATIQKGSLNVLAVKGQYVTSNTGIFGNSIRMTAP